MDDILALLNLGLQKAASARTAMTLGDRSRYVGMSDIGRAVDCLRAAVADKLAVSAASGTPQASEHQENAALAHELRTQRGHWFESGIAEAFRFMGKPFLHQLRIQTTHNNVPIRAHPDFVFVSSKGEIHVVECKSCECLPDTAYAAHETQLAGQLGFLAACWTQPCFSLDNGGSPLSFPLLVKKELGIDLSQSSDNTVITGTLLHVSMTEVKTFGPYAPNTIMRDICQGLADTIWSSMEKIRSGNLTINDLPTARGWHPLCDYCAWNADCPRFTGISAPELEEDLLDLRDLKLEKEILCQRIRALEEGLKATARQISPTGNWINAVSQRFRLGVCEGRKTLDKDLLASALATSLPGETAENVIQAGMKTGEVYERLHIGTINKKEE
jgi:hypothetical protein